MRLFIGLIALAIGVVMFRSFVPLAVLISVFGVASLLASRKNKVVMTINRDGFFYYGSLVTNWTNFVSARFVDEVPQLSKSSLGISDQFYLAVRYRKEAGGACFERKIALTNTQDKAEEEIMAAIRFYYENSRDKG
jgi:hypothetical protein